MFQSMSAAAKHGRARLLLPAILGALVWSAAAAGSVLLRLSHWADNPQATDIAERFALGALIAFPIAYLLAQLLARTARSVRRFTVFFFMLGIATAGTTALVFASQSIRDAASWHGHPVHLIGIWVFYAVVTEFYEFAVIGMRLYFPYTLAALFAFSLWFAVRPR